MLKIDPHQTFETTATINLKALKASFGIKCRFLHIDRLDELRKKWTGTPAVQARAATDIEPAVNAVPAVPPTMNDREFIDSWLIGFADDVLGTDDQPLPFTPENVTKLLSMPGAKMAVINAFFSGYEEAEEKNSAPLRGGS